MNVMSRALTVGLAAAGVAFFVLVAFLFFSYGGRVRSHEIVGAAHLAAVAGLVGLVLGPFSYASISGSRSTFGAFWKGVAHSILIYTAVVLIGALGNREPTSTAIGRFLLFFALLFVMVGWATTLLGGIVAVVIYARSGHGAQPTVPDGRARVPRARR
jgi:hypothetical protein